MARLAEEEEEDEEDAKDDDGHRSGPPLADLPRTLILDGHDSYTRNILDLILSIFPNHSSQLNKRVIIIPASQVDWSTLSTQIIPHFAAIILGPGPGRPSCSATDHPSLDSRASSADQHPTQTFTKILSPDTLPSLCNGHHIPTFGLCLGHQALGFTFGAKLIRAPRVLHGQTSDLILELDHQSNPIGLFKSFPTTSTQHHPTNLNNTHPNTNDTHPSSSHPIIRVVRYNSLSLDPTSISPDHPLQITAWAQDDPSTRTIMALSHKSLPFHSVQFHPESICSTNCTHIIRSFYQLVSQSSYLNCSKTGLGRSVAYSSLPDNILRYDQLRRFSSHHSIHPSRPIRFRSTPCFELRTFIFDYPDDHPTSLPSPSKLFQKFIKPISPLGSVWLDSSDCDRDLKSGYIDSTQQGLNRSSHLGSVDILLSYFAHHQVLSIRTSSSDHSSSSPYEDRLNQSSTFWDWLRSVQVELKARTKVLAPNLEFKSSSHHQDRDSLPNSKPQDQRIHPAPIGFMGYFSYEMLSESLKDYNLPCRSSESIPDVELGFCNTVLSFNHSNPTWIASALVSMDESSNLNLSEDQNEIDLQDCFYKSVGLTETGFKSWIADIKRILGSPINELDDDNSNRSTVSISQTDHQTSTSSIVDRSCELKPILSEVDYLGAISEAQEIINSGEAYELCLTTQFQGQLGIQTTSITTTKDVDDPDHFKRYLHLRRSNPAPYSAYINFKAYDTHILSSSPERFMSIDPESNVEMKPIKGTARRNLKDFKEDLRIKERLRNDLKELGENLMITDLIRHDLNGICELGSVKVEKLFEVESILSVHSLVSIVQGKFRSDLNIIDGLRSCFPPGSMTGSPKLSSIFHLDLLERQVPRNIYSGILGFISIFDTLDFNVIIRTAIIRNNHISIGGGGAITNLSNKQDELNEVKLKIESVQKKLNLSSSSSCPTSTSNDPSIN